MQIYFVRHGESEANVLREISNRGRKHPLTTLGRSQAEALGRELHGERFARIYASPLLRAVETAEILSQHLAAPVCITPALSEGDLGVLEGRSDVDAWRLVDELIEEWYTHGRLEKRVEGGESLHDIRARFVPFVESLLAAPADENLLLVGHGGTYVAMLPVILGNVDHAFALANPIINCGCIIAEASSEGLVCRSWCGREVRPDARS
ncbi:MAG TPA: histidine phosphatase family protein [Chloroflexota bacterium]|nr:histidine phosphatase family protein [Chloroflexota bacterium]